MIFLKSPLELLLFQLQLPLEFLHQKLHLHFQLHFQTLQAVFKLLTQQTPFFQVEFDNFAFTAPYGPLVDELDRFTLVANQLCQPLDAFAQRSNTGIVAMQCSYARVAQTKRTNDWAMETVEVCTNMRSSFFAVSQTGDNPWDEWTIVQHFIMVFILGKQIQNFKLKPNQIKPNALKIKCFSSFYSSWWNYLSLFVFFRGQQSQNYTNAPLEIYGFYKIVYCNYCIYIPKNLFFFSIQHIFQPFAHHLSILEPYAFLYRDLFMLLASLLLQSSPLLRVYFMDYWITACTVTFVFYFRKSLLVADRTHVLEIRMAIHYSTFDTDFEFNYCMAALYFYLCHLIQKLNFCFDFTDDGKNKNFSQI